MGRGPTKEFYKDFNEEYVEGTLTCLRQDVIKAKINTEFPLVLNIEPTNDCNAHCFYCPRKIMVAEKGLSYMSLEDYKMIIDQIPEKLIMLNFHKDGESLLHKDLPEMIRYAKEKDVAKTVHINTNGTLINTKIGRGIIENGIDDITVSIDASFEETYYKLKKLKGFGKLEENVRKAIAYRNEIGSKTKIRVKIMEFGDVGHEEVEHFIKKWTGVADEVQVTGTHNWSGSIDDIEITDEQSPKRYPCVLLWYMLAINSDGEASTCSVDWNRSSKLGNIHDSTIKEIWNGERIREIRRKQLDGIWDDPNVCDECVVWVSVGDMREYLKTRKEFL